MINLNFGKKNFFFYFIFIISIFLFDRLSKIIIIKKSKEISSGEIFSSKFINIQLVWNDGIAFGLFSFNQETFYNMLTIIIGLIIIVVFWFLLKSKRLEKIGFAMILGGALGNIFDRIYYSSVPDFIDLHYNEFHWFIFNIADIFITLGIICLIIVEILFNNIENNENY